MNRQILLYWQAGVLRDLYKLNLQAYVGVDVVVFDDRKLFLEKSKQRTINDKLVILPPEADDLLEQLVLVDQMEIILVGHRKSQYTEIHLAPNRFDIRDLVRSVAKICGITALDMIKRKVTPLYQVPNEILSRYDHAPFNIYMSDKGTLAFKRGAKIAVIEKEQDYYVYSSERLAFINKASELIVEELKTQNLSVMDKVEISSEITRIVATNISKSEHATEQINELTSQCMAAIDDVIKSAPKLSSLLELLRKNPEGYVYAHSVLASYIAQEIIMLMDWGNAEQARKVSFVLFFHDLFLVPLYLKYPWAKREEDLIFSDEVTDEEKEIVYDHAIHASNFIKTMSKAPLGADVLALQHHGSARGAGFPGFFGDDISPLAKVIVVSHEIVEQVLAKEPYGEFDKKEVVEKLKEKFTKSTYRKIIEAFLQVDF